MASKRMSTPMRGITSQLGRFSIRHDISPTSTSSTRSITTSATSRASISSITTSADAPPPIVPLEQRTVNATIHHFPTLEPLRFESFPVNHLYLPTRRDILHRAVIFEGDATRRGTASTKWRSEVRGSSRKIRPQKGSGRARLGDKKSPMLKGGGVAFGPKPRDFSTGLQKKVYDLAWRTALSYRFRKGELIVVDNALEIESPSRALLKGLFAMHKWGKGYGRTLLVTLRPRPFLDMTLAEAPEEGRTMAWKEVDVKNMLEAGRIVIERHALGNLLLSHQSDLQSNFQKLHGRLDPVELERIPGWTAFRDLELADPGELPELRPRLYERLAEKRLAEAHKDEIGVKNPPPSDKRIQAYWLLTEAKEARRELASRHPDMQLQKSEDPDLRAKGLAKRIEVLQMEAESNDMEAAAYRLNGNEDTAVALDVAADDARAAAEEKRAEMNELLGVEIPVEEIEEEEFEELIDPAAKVEKR